jgi:hypothetical protein
MSAANPDPMEKSMVSVLVVANAGGGVAVAVWCVLHHGIIIRAMATPPAISATTNEVIDFSLEFGFAALYYIVLEICRTLHVDSITFRRAIRVFTRFSCVFGCPVIFGRPASRNGHP